MRSVAISCDALRCVVVLYCVVVLRCVCISRVSVNAITDGVLFSRRCLLRVEMCEDNAVVFGLLVCWFHSFANCKMHSQPQIVCEIQTRMQGKTAETKKCVCEIEADSRDASERKGEPKEQERKRKKRKKEGLQHLVFPCGHPSQY